MVLTIVALLQPARGLWKASFARRSSTVAASSSLEDAFSATKENAGSFRSEKNFVQKVASTSALAVSIVNAGRRVSMGGGLAWKVLLGAYLVDMVLYHPPCGLIWKLPLDAKLHAQVTTAGFFGLVGALGPPWLYILYTRSAGLWVWGLAILPVLPFFSNLLHDGWLLGVNHDSDWMQHPAILPLELAMNSLY